MKCPICGCEQVKVVDSRSAMGGYAVRRRRECLSCAYRFSTYEEAEILDLIVIKKDNKREVYSKEKLKIGLLKSLEKRPCTQDDLKQLISRIEIGIQLLRKAEVKSEEIGRIVMEELKNFDEVAYIRYASVYKSFKDVKTLHQEIAKLLE